MSSNKTQKWSSSSSFSKLLSRISRTLSFTSKKSQQTFKNNNKKIKPTETVIKNVNFVPQSVPITRRHASQPISKLVYTDNSKKGNCHRDIIHENMFVESDIEGEDDDYLRYSLQPNLSLFNISLEDLNDQSQDNTPRHHDWLDDIFHSTKIEEN